MKRAGAAALLLLVATAARAEPPPLRDACGEDEPVVDAADADRTLVWSCMGVGLDLPPGLHAHREAGDGLSGLTVVVTDAHDPPRFEARLTATHLEFEPRDALRLALGDDVDAGGFRIRAAGPVKKTAPSVSRRYQQTVDGARVAAVRTFLVLDLQQLDVVAVSDHFDAATLARKTAPLTKLRPLSAKERARLPAARDWRADLVDRRIPVNDSSMHGRTTHLLALCPDGRYRAFDADGKAPAALRGVPAEGRWRLAHTTLWAGAPGVWRTGGVYQDLPDRFVVGPFGSTNGAPPYAPAGDLCAGSAPRR